VNYVRAERDKSVFVLIQHLNQLDREREMPSVLHTHPQRSINELDKRVDEQLQLRSIQL